MRIKIALGFLAVVALLANFTQYHENTKVIQARDALQAEYSAYQELTKANTIKLGRMIVDDELLLDAYRRACYGTVRGKSER